MLQFDVGKTCPETYVSPKEFFQYTAPSQQLRYLHKFRSQIVPPHPREFHSLPERILVPSLAALSMLKLSLRCLTIYWFSQSRPDCQDGNAHDENVLLNPEQRLQEDHDKEDALLADEFQSCSTRQCHPTSQVPFRICYGGTSYVLYWDLERS